LTQDGEQQPVDTWPFEAGVALQLPLQDRTEKGHARGLLELSALTPTPDDAATLPCGTRVATSLLQLPPTSDLGSNS
jgi:hypothetical protein